MAEKQNSWLSGLLGIKIHFVNGAHVVFPRCTRKFHLRVSTQIGGLVSFDGDVQCELGRNMEFVSLQTFYLPWTIEVTQAGQHVFVHHFNPVGRPVCINLEKGTLEHVAVWLPVCKNFQYVQNCHLTVLMQQDYIQKYDSDYPDIRFIAPEQYVPEQYYAVYPVGCWGDGNENNNPADFQKDSLVKHAENILGVLGE